MIDRMWVLLHLNGITSKMRVNNYSGSVEKYAYKSTESICRKDAYGRLLQNLLYTLRKESSKNYNTACKI